MKKKTINIILCRKFDAWVGSITDEAVKKLVEKNTIITGGSITSMFLNEKVNDFDIYFRDKETTLAVANYYVDLFTGNPPTRFKNDFGHCIPIEVKDEVDRVSIFIKSSGIASEVGSNDYQYFESTADDSLDATQFVEAVTSVLNEPAVTENKGGKYRPVFLTDNAITLSDRIQIIIRFFGEPAIVHENFDFVHCTNFWDSRSRQLTLNVDAMVCAISKELRYVGSRYPLCSVIRTSKFIQRGWTINAGQMLKMMMQLSKLDLTDLAVLKEQLIGVDVAYFAEVLRKLGEKDASKVDGAYLIEIIDRMF